MVLLTTMKNIDMEHCANPNANNSEFIVAKSKFHCLNIYATIEIQFELILLFEKVWKMAD